MDNTVKNKLQDVNLIFVGDAGVGKTSIIYRLSSNKFSNDLKSTIGGSYAYYINEDYDINIAVWDTAGQEKFSPILPMFYRKADIVALTINISNYNYSYVKKQLDHHLAAMLEYVHEECKLIILLNKCDLGTDPLQYNNIVRDVEQIVILKNIIGFEIVIMSAKAGVGFSDFNIHLSLFSNNIRQKKIIKDMDSSVNLINNEVKPKTNCLC